MANIDNSLQRQLIDHYGNDTLKVVYSESDTSLAGMIACDIVSSKVRRAYHGTEIDREINNLEMRLAEKLRKDRKNGNQS